MTGAIRTIRRRTTGALGALLVVVGTAVGAVAGGTGPAGAAGGSPWTAGTVFVAANGENPDSTAPGGLFAVEPGVGTRTLWSGEADDVTVDPAGDVYWTDTNAGSTGGVFEYEASGTERQLPTPGDYPDGIGWDAATGTVLVGESSGLLEQSPGEIVSIDPVAGTSTVLTTLPSAGSASSIAVDGNGDVYVRGTFGVEVIVPGATTPSVVPTPSDVSLWSVRLDGSDDLVLGNDTYAGDVAVVDPATQAETDVGTSADLTDVWSADVDQSGDVFAGADGVGGDFATGIVEEFPVGGGPAVTIDGAVNRPTGLAVYPPVTPAGRTASTVTLSTTTPTVDAGGSASLSVQVGTGGAPASGYVELEEGGRPVGTPVALTDGGATITVTPPTGSAGQDAVDDYTALYVGTSAVLPSVSAAVPVTVVPDPVTVTLTSAKTSYPQDQGAPVTVTVTAAGGGSGLPLPSGSVEITGGPSPTYGEVGATDQFSVTVALSPGSNPLVATFTPYGGTDFATGSSATRSVKGVAPYAAAVHAAASVGTKVFGSTPVTLSVSVVGVPAGGAPTGAVTAKSGSWSCTPLVAATSATSTATCTADLVGSGRKTVTVSYGGATKKYGKAATTVSVNLGGGGGGG